MKNQPGKIVYVEWVDSVGHEGWRSLEELSDPPPLTCVSCGFLVRETEDVITVAASWSATGRFDETISIPWCAVTKYEEVSFL